MSEAYSKELIVKAKQIAAKHNIKVVEGVYVGTTGPTFETPAEYRYFRTIGGDAVGMSTVPEVIVANHAGLKCFGISIVTDLGVPRKNCGSYPRGSSGNRQLGTTAHDPDHERTDKLAVND